MSTLPQKRKPTKAQKRLAARLRDWESMRDSLDAKNKRGSYNQLAFRKPGSNKK